MQHEQIRLGELLVRSSVLTDRDLSELLLYAKLVGLPLGQIIVQQGDLTRAELLGALQIQAFYLEDLLNEETMIKACKLVCKKKMPLEQALRESGFSDQDALSSRLGDLLTQSGLLEEADLNWALMTAGELAIPLGHALIQTGVIKPNIVAAALGYQKQIRQKTLALSDAMQKLSELKSAANQT